MKKSKYRAETVEQFKIMTWLQRNYSGDDLAEVTLVDRNHVRIRDRYGGMAILTYSDGEVYFRNIFEAC